MVGTLSARAARDRAGVVESGLVSTSLTVLRAGTSMVVAVAAARALGAHDFGRWTILSTWAALLTMLSELGTSLWLTREAARVEHGHATMFARAGVLRVTALAALGLPATAALMWFDSAEHGARAWSAAWALACAGAVYGALAAVWRGRLWLRPLLIIESGGAVVQAAALLWLLRSPSPSLVALLAAATAIQIAQFAAALAWWQPARGEWATAVRGLPSTLRPLLTASWPFAGLGLIAQVHARWVPLALGAMHGEAVVGIYGAASRVGDALKLVPHAWIGAAYPVWAAQGREGQARAMATTARVATWPWSWWAGSAAIAGVLILVAPATVRIVFGPRYEAAAQPLAWLALALIPALHNATTRTRLLACGLERAVVDASMRVLLPQLLLGLVLMWFLGAGGAALAVLLGELQLALALRPLGAVPTFREAEIQALE